MKKASTLLVVAILLSCQLSYSQVTRQYQDQSFAETTVVIKDNKETSDIDVLNNYFNLDDVGVGQVIRITTETHSPVVRKAPAQAPQEVKPVVVAAATVPKAKPVIEAPIQIQEVNQEPEGFVGSPIEQPTKRVRSTGGNYPVKARGFSGNLQKKKIKKKKRTKKRSKRNRGKCYAF